MTRAPCSTTTSERMKIARRLSRSDEDEMQRPLDGGAGGDADHCAIAHQRGVERDRDVVRRRQACRDGPIASDHSSASASASEPIVKPRFQSRRCRTTPAQTRRRRTRAGGDSTSPSHCAGGFRARLRRGVRRARERLGVAHERAQVGIFPVLDAAVRQAFPGEHIESGGTLLGDRAAAGQPRARLRKFLRQRRLRGRLYDFHFSHGIHVADGTYAAASS